MDVTDSMKKKWHIFTYGPIDDLFYCHTPDIHSTRTQKELDDIKLLFRKEGWEGDGELKNIWLPPFLFGESSPVGECIWIVKQKNNGTCFIASQIEIPIGYLGPINPTGLEIASEIQKWNEEVENYFEKKIWEYKDLTDDIKNKTFVLNQRTMSAINSWHICELCSCIEKFMSDLFQLLFKARFLYGGRQFDINFNQLKIILDDIDSSLDKYHSIHKFQLIQIDEICKNIPKIFDKLCVKDKVSLVQKALHIKKNDEMLLNIIILFEVRNCLVHSQGIFTRETFENRLGKKVPALWNDLKTDEKIYLSNKKVGTCFIQACKLFENFYEKYFTLVGRG